MVLEIRMAHLAQMCGQLCPEFSVSSGILPPTRLLRRRSEIWWSVLSRILAPMRCLRRRSKIWGLVSSRILAPTRTLSRRSEICWSIFWRVPSCLPHFPEGFEGESLCPVMVLVIGDSSLLVFLFVVVGVGGWVSVVPWSLSPLVSPSCLVVLY